MLMFLSWHTFPEILCWTLIAKRPSAVIYLPASIEQNAFSANPVIVQPEFDICWIGISWQHEVLSVVTFWLLATHDGEVKSCPCHNASSKQCRAHEENIATPQRLTGVTLYLCLMSVLHFDVVFPLRCCWEIGDTHWCCTSTRSAHTWILAYLYLSYLKVESLLNIHLPSFILRLFSWYTSHLYLPRDITHPFCWSHQFFFPSLSRPGQSIRQVLPADRKCSFRWPRLVWVQGADAGAAVWHFLQWQLGASNCQWWEQSVLLIEKVVNSIIYRIK